MAELSDERKFKWLSLAYFGVSDNPQDDVNPFRNLNEFLDAPVGALGWGFDPEVRRRSKIRFAFNFYNVMKIYSVILTIDQIMNSIGDDSQLNRDVVSNWVNVAIFPGQA